MKKPKTIEGYAVWIGDCNLPGAIVHNGEVIGSAIFTSDYQNRAQEYAIESMKKNFSKKMIKEFKIKVVRLKMTPLPIKKK